MKEKRIIIFEHSLNGHGDINLEREEIEFDINATDDEIRGVYEDWVWELVGDKMTWYDKEE